MMTDTPATFLAPRRILTPEEMQLIRSAGEYLAQMRDLHSTLEAEIRRNQEDARREGFDLGYQDGRRAAFEDLVNMVSTARAKVTTSEAELFELMISAIEQIMGTLEPRDLARKILSRALEDNAEGISLKVLTAVEEVEPILEDVATLRQTPGLPEIRAVEADPLLKRGEIVLETPRGRIHIGLQHQLNRLKDALQRLEAQGTQ
jgi:type III secretion protein L